MVGRPLNMALEGVEDDGAADLEALLDGIAPRFDRREPRQRARLFVRGILSELRRKNGWTLARYAGDVDPNGMQRLLTTARWDVEGVRDDVRSWVAGRFAGRRGAVLVGHVSAFPKKGNRS